MKKTALAILCLILPSLFAVAQDMPTVAIVDLDRVLRNSEKAQQADREIRNRQELFDAELRPMAEEINQLREERNTLISRLQSPATSESGQRDAREQLRNLEQVLEQKAIDFQNLRNEANQTLQEIRNNRLGAMLDEIRGIVAVIAERKGADLVLNAQEGFILFAAPKFDLTDEVLSELNKKKESR